MAKRNSEKTLSGADRLLCEQAREAAKNAYAPYSGFAVGSAARSVTGEIFVGANLENASYGLSICAEVAALAGANAAGADRIEAIAIVGYRFAPEFEVTGIVSPCGRCRQLIWEASCRSETNIKVFCCNGDLSEITVYSIQELLPAAFDVAKLRQFEPGPADDNSRHGPKLKFGTGR